MMIGFLGPHGVGKSEACRHLVEKHGFTEIAFTTPLKHEVRTRLRGTLLALAGLYRRLSLEGSGVLGFPGEEDEERTLDALLTWKPAVVRTLLREYGTEVRRTDDPDYWIKAWDRALYGYRDARVCVPDVRYENEWQAMSKYGARLVEIVRPGSGWDVSHASERGAMRLTRYASTLISNAGTLAEFHATLDYDITAIPASRPTRGGHAH